MKRAVSLFLSLCISFSLLIPGVLAGAQNDAAEMQRVLGVVKSKISIPAEYKNFEYDVSTSSNQNQWEFCWYKQKENGRITISCDNQGRINRYRKEDFGEKGSKAPKILRNEAQDSALTFIKKVVPEVSSKLSILDPIGTVSWESLYSIGFTRIENKIPCDAQKVWVQVNYLTGEVVGLSVTWDYDMSFPKPEKTISEAQVRKIWKDSIKMELSYRLKDSISKDGKTTTQAYLVYTPNETAFPIDAVSGELIREEFKWSPASESDMGGAGGAKNEAMQNKAAFDLTEEEIKKSNEYANLMTAAQADAKVRALKNLSLTSENKLQNSSLSVSQDTYPVRLDKDSDVKYVWMLEYRCKTKEGEHYVPTISAVVDAKTGELLRYSDYENRFESKWKGNPKDIPQMKVNESQAKTIAQGLVKGSAPDKYKSTKMIETQPDVIEVEKKKIDIGKNFVFTRVHENIMLHENAFDIYVDYASGKICSYNQNWAENVVFEPTKAVINQDSARDLYIDNATPALNYNIFTTYYYDEKADSKSKPIPKVFIPKPGVEAQKKEEPILVFRFDSLSNAIGGTSGKYIDYNGNEVKDEPAFTGYKDIGGYFAEREIRLLADIGALPQKEKFEPKAAITQEKFLEYLFMGCGYWSLDGENDVERRKTIYQIASREGVIMDNEIAPEAPLSKYDAILFTVRYAGFGEILKDASIFQVGYKDAKDIPSKYLGAVAIAKSTKIWAAPGGVFAGSDNLTNGECAKIIYDFLAMNRK